MQESVAYIRLLLSFEEWVYKTVDDYNCDNCKEFSVSGMLFRCSDSPRYISATSLFVLSSNEYRRYDIPEDVDFLMGYEFIY